MPCVDKLFLFVNFGFFFQTDSQSVKGTRVEFWVKIIQFGQGFASEIIIIIEFVICEIYNEIDDIKYFYYKAVLYIQTKEFAKRYI